jgi:hypothetical protein
LEFQQGTKRSVYGQVLNLDMVHFVRLRK